MAMVQLVQVSVPSSVSAAPSFKHLSESVVVRSTRSWQVAVLALRPNLLSRRGIRHRVQGHATWDARCPSLCSARCSSRVTRFSGYSCKAVRRSGGIRELCCEFEQSAKCTSYGVCSEARVQRLVCFSCKSSSTRRTSFDENNQKSYGSLSCGCGSFADSSSQDGDQKVDSAHLQQSASNWVHIGNCIRVAFVLWGAATCISWFLATRPVLAAENSSLVIPQMSSRAAEVWGRFWPKTLQVLAVFREHGLLLSGLLGLSAFFSMAETSITTLWPWKVRELAEREQEGGVFQMLRNDVTRFLTTILIGTTVANIAATALVTDAATALFGEAGVSAATGVMTVVILLVTEIAPKSIAVHNATEVARVVVRPVAWLSLILYPVGRVVTALSTNLLKFLGLKHSGEPFVSEDELKLMLRGAELSGAIEEEEQDMIENVLEIKDTYVREVMTPLVDVVAIDSGASLMDFRQLWVKHQYSRVPVFERRVDNIVGIAYAMDMLDYVEQVELLQRLTVGRIAHRPAYFVPDSMSVWNLLREFRIRKVHMAIVLNEYGGAVGVVTLEDVVEEIVGEIFDENDSKEEIRKKTGYVIQRADGTFDVDANTSIEDLTDALEIKVPEGPYHYETVSGFVCEAFGYIPRTGESISVVFDKADYEDGPDRRDGDQDHHDDRKEKFQRFNLEILAGNARKVGSVRFERLEGSQTRDGFGVHRHPSRLVKRGWEGHDPSSEMDKRASSKEWEDVGFNPYQSESSDDEEYDDLEDVCLAPNGADQLKSPGRRRYLIAEQVDVVDSEPNGLVADGLTVMGPQDWQMDVLEKPPDGQDLETTDEVDTSTASAVGSLCEKWQEQEKQVERRRQRRRKQSAEAALELNRQRRADIRRRDSDMATALYRSRARDDSNSSDQDGTR